MINNVWELFACFACFVFSIIWILESVYERKDIIESSNNNEICGASYSGINQK